MSISFSCRECGKPFTLDDKFAGKRGKCKDCGSILQIPFASTASSPSPRPASSSRRAPAAGPAADVYGFDDAPAAPRSIGPSALMGDEDGPPPAPPRARKPKAGGLFASQSKSSSTGGNLLRTIVARVVFGIVGTVVAIGASALGLPGLRSIVDPNWSSRSRIDAFIKRQVDLTKDLTGVLRAVTDEPTAASASPKANDLLRKLASNLTTNKDRRGNQKDIDAVKEKYLLDSQQAARDFGAECLRIAMIPGAADALAIETELNKLAAIEQSIPGANVQAGLGPPAMPRPGLNPPSIPPANFPRSPMPPGPVGQPGPPPGFGPNGFGGNPPGTNRPGPPGFNRPPRPGRDRPGATGPG